MSDPLAETLRRLAEDLDGAGASWALIGGLAVSVRTEPRFTRDVDVAVAAPDDATAESIGAQLVRAGYAVVWELEQKEAGRLAGLRLVPPGGSAQGVVVDLLFASSGLEPEIAAQAEPLEVVAGLSVPVAPAGHLIALKLLARDDERRPQDTQDLKALLGVATRDELDAARDAVARIEDRGFARGRDLRGDLQALLERGGERA